MDFPFGITISRRKAPGKGDTRSQIMQNAAQGPLTPYFTEHYHRKISGDFYEALREGIPVIDAAIRKLISLNGTIEIIGDNPQLVRELEDFCLHVPVNDQQHGIQAFLENACNETFEQGFSISEYIMSKDMKDIERLRVADSKDISFRRNATGGMDTWFRHRGMPSNHQIISSPTSLVERILTAQFNQSLLINGMWEEKLRPGNKLYFSIGNENGNPYGVSLMRSMEFCAKLLATIQNSLLNVWERFGDPSFHVSYGLTKRSLGGDTLETRRQQIATDFNTAIRAKRSGKSADFISALNADDKMDIKVIGSGDQELNLELPARHVMEQLISKTGLPSWMLAHYWSTTERMATLEVETVLQDAKIRQLAMLPGFIRLLGTQLKARGRKWQRVTTSIDKPGDWGIIFKTPNLRDMVAQAQARFLNAQADMMGREAEGSQQKGAPYVIKQKQLKAACHCGAPQRKEIERTDPWPSLDKVEDEYEARLKADWADLQTQISALLLPVVSIEAKGISNDAFTFTIEERALIMAALKTHLGAYDLSADDSPVTWYYGQAYSLGLIQAAELLGEERPILDLLKNQEIFEKLAAEGLERVKDQATKAIRDKILAEMEAFAIAGSNPNEVAQRLEKLFGDANSDWERLARSEMSMAAETAKLEEWKAWQIKRTDFVPAPDACAICVALEGEYAIEDAPIPVADTHPRCRCANRPAASEAE